MIAFSPSNPFPLLDPSKHSALALSAHAAEVDRWLGLRATIIERELDLGIRQTRSPRFASLEPQELWRGLDVQSLMTPYIEIRALLDRLAPAPGQTVVDLGAAYARMAFVIARHHRGVRFVGYEFIGNRIEEGRRCFDRFIDTMKVNASFIHADLAAADFQPVEADFYFIYDFGHLKAIEKSLYDLKRIARTRPIIVIARGRHCRYLITRRHDWLIQAFPDTQESAVTIYRSFDYFLGAGEAVA